MRRITRDFITLFNVFWYRDFPLARQHKETGSRAEWTTHIGIGARAAADLMGYFTYFEHGNRTDAVIKDNQGSVISNLEWDAYSRPRLPLIPDEVCHPFHAKAATNSTAKLPPQQTA